MLCLSTVIDIHHISPRENVAKQTLHFFNNKRTAQSPHSLICSFLYTSAYLTPALRHSSFNAIANPLPYLLGAYDIYISLVVVHLYQSYREEEYYKISGKRRQSDPDLYDKDGNYDPP